MVTFVDCIVAGKIDKELTYETDTPITVGTIVEVPLRGKATFALVTKNHKSFECSYKLKPIIRCTPYVYNETFIAFLKKSAAYTIQEIGLFLKASLFVPTTEKQLLETPPYPSQSNISLSKLLETIISILGESVCSKGSWWY